MFWLLNETSLRDVFLKQQEYKCIAGNAKAFSFVYTCMLLKGELFLIQTLYKSKKIGPDDFELMSLDNTCCSFYFAWHQEEGATIAYMSELKLDIFT